MTTAVITFESPVCEQPRRSALDEQNKMAMDSVLGGVVLFAIMIFPYVLMQSILYQFVLFEKMKNQYSSLMKVLFF